MKWYPIAPEGPLTSAKVGDRWLVCTGHYWEFDVLTGAGPEGSCLAAFAARRQDGVVEVGIPSADADATA